MSLKSYTAALSYTESHNKTDTKTKKDGCGTARHFHNKCCHSISLYIFVFSLLRKLHSGFELSHNKSDIKTIKDGCGTARHFHKKCCHSSNPFVYLCVQLIEKVYCIYDDCNIEEILWDKRYE